MRDTAPSPAPEHDAADLAGWDAPPRRPPDASASPVLSVDGFEGPLDWLLEMARARRIDIAQLSILALVEAFGAALAAALAPSALSATALGRWGDWLVMAADLTLLRSRLLTPAGTADAREAQDQAEALRRRLVGRAEMAVAAGWLERREQLGRDVFVRGRPQAAGAVAGARTGGGDVVALLRACLAALELPADAGAIFRVPVRPFWTVAEAVARIRALLPGLGEEGGELATFLPSVPGDASDRERRCRVAVVGTFLGALELVREGGIVAKQDQGFGRIVFKPASA